jgi:hypothetical protein
MYYTKIALLTFGAGLVLGLAVVVIEIDWLGRVASGVMALGLMTIPIGMIVDWRLATKTVRRLPKARGAMRARPKAGARPKAAQPRLNPRPRKPTSSKPKR